MPMPHAAPGILTFPPAMPAAWPAVWLTVFLVGLPSGCAAVKHRRGMNRIPAASTMPVTDDRQDDTQQLWADLWRTPLAAPVEDPKDAAYLGAPSSPARLLACQLPLRIATDRAWALTDETLLPPPTRARWHANGLRVGVLSASKWEAFRQALNGREKGAPPHQGVMAQKMITLTVRPFAEPLHKGDALPADAPLPLDTTLPPFAPARQILPVASGDRMQLLAQGDFQAKALTGLTLIPHLHHPAYFFGGAEPPKAWEKEAQGRQITELGTPKWQPKPGQLLVIGLWWPWKKESSNTEVKPAEKTAEKPGEKTANPPADDLVISPIAPPFLPSLGRALFTSQNGEGEYQVLLVLGVK